mmetsp:Transcript_37865/g.106399  ORF Transcript_37865/g.106399 Transcript_37865/m.106399 type:complete len:206 (-) Transcript_37865:732-1349(-)
MEAERVVLDRGVRLQKGGRQGRQGVRRMREASGDRPAGPGDDVAAADGRGPAVGEGRPRHLPDLPRGRHEARRARPLVPGSGEGVQVQLASRAPGPHPDRLVRGALRPRQPPARPLRREAEDQGALGRQPPGRQAHHRRARRAAVREPPASAVPHRDAAHLQGHPAEQRQGRRLSGHLAAGGVPASRGRAHGDRGHAYGLQGHQG